MAGKSVTSTAGILGGMGGIGGQIRVLPTPFFRSGEYRVRHRPEHATYPTQGPSQGRPPPAQRKARAATVRHNHRQRPAPDLPPVPIPTGDGVAAWLAVQFRSPYFLAALDAERDAPLPGLDVAYLMRYVAAVVAAADGQLTAELAAHRNTVTEVHQQPADSRWTVGKLSEVTGLSLRAIQREARRGAIPGAVRVGKWWRFREAGVRQWLTYRLLREDR